MPIRKKLLALLLAAVLVCTMSLTAFAREAPDTSRKGSIQLTIRQGGTAVPGGSSPCIRWAPSRRKTGTTALS